MAGYLKVADIPGESQDEGHKDWINLLSVSHNLSNPMPVGAKGSTKHKGTVVFGDIILVKECDKSTPKLQKAVADGTNYPKVEIHLTTSSSGGKRIPYLVWELKNATITSYSFSGACEGTGVPTEQLGFNFEEIKLIYDCLGKDHKSGGKIDYGWKVEEGVPA